MSEDNNYKTVDFVGTPYSICDGSKMWAKSVRCQTKEAAQRQQECQRWSHSAVSSEALAASSLLTVETNARQVCAVALLQLQWSDFQRIFLGAFRAPGV